MLFFPFLRANIGWKRGQRNGALRQLTRKQPTPQAIGEWNVGARRFMMMAAEKNGRSSGTKRALAILLEAGEKAGGIGGVLAG